MDFASKDETDVYFYLVDKGFDQGVAKILEGQDIDGQSFLELTMDELNRLFPDSLGTVKKLYRLIQSELAKTKPSTVPESDAPPQTSPSSVSSRRSNHDAASTSSSCSVGSSAASGAKKFILPDTWRPSIMYAIKGEGDTERRKRLTPELRNEIVRDIVSTMYAHTCRPNKAFCTDVAKQLVRKYPFMKDTGINVSEHGSWEKRLVERVGNVGKGVKKRDLDSASSAPPPKRGRPKLENPILQRYPPLQPSVDIDEDKMKALQKELEKEKPRKDVVLPLLKETFPERRHFVLSTQVSVVELTERYKSFLLPYALEQEVDIILKKRDVIKAAIEDWKSKWTPAILAYVKTLKSKAIKTALRVLESKFRDDEEEDEKNALYLMVSLMLRGDPEENVRMVYEEHQIADDPSVVAGGGKTSAPIIASFQDVDGTNEYFIIVEKKVLFGGLTSFCKSLALWFSLHYIFNLEYDKAVNEVALFMQEFVFGLPASKVKKKSTYLTVSSDVQTFTAT